MTLYQYITVNLIPGGALPVVHASKGDKGIRTVNCDLANGQTFTRLTAGVTATVDGKTPSGAKFSQACQLYDASQATFNSVPYALFDITEEMTAEPGRVVCQITLHDGDDIVGSGNFILDVEDSPL